MCVDYFDDPALKTINVISYISMIVFRCFITFIDESSKDNFLFEPFNNETFSNNYLLPKQYTFGIWGLIYILLGGFVIYQWSKAANTATVEGVECHFCASSVLSISWLAIFWLLPRYNQIFILLDAFVLATNLVILNVIYNNLKSYPPKSFADRILIHYPFTIYFAWTIIETILNFWIAIPTLNTVIISTTAVVCIGLVGLYFVDQCNDFIFSAVISWALVGIIIKQYETLLIVIAASFSIGLILGGIFRSLSLKYNAIYL